MSSFKSRGNINGIWDGPCRGFGYSSLISDPINLILNRAEHEKGFIISGLGLYMYIFLSLLFFLFYLMFHTVPMKPVKRLKYYVRLTQFDLLI